MFIKHDFNHFCDISDEITNILRNSHKCEDRKRSARFKYQNQATTQQTILASEDTTVQIRDNEQFILITYSKIKHICQKFYNSVEYQTKT